MIMYFSNNKYLFLFIFLATSSCVYYFFNSLYLLYKYKLLTKRTIVGYLGVSGVILLYLTAFIKGEINHINLFYILIPSGVFYESYRKIYKYRKENHK